MEKTYIDKLALLDIKDRKVLMTLTKGKDTWYTPGGKREVGETDEEALTRETKEEIGLALLPESLKFYGIFEAQAHGKPEGVFVRNTFYCADYRGFPQPCSEIEEISYFTYDQKHQVSLLNQSLFEELKAKDLID